MWLIQGDDFVLDGVDYEVRSFYVSKTMVTNEHYEIFRPEHAQNRAAVADDKDDPVVNLTFDEASAYAEWYAGRTGKSFRLLTELEWRFAFEACRSWFRDGDVWHKGRAEGRTRPAEAGVPNPLGLVDGLGNVREWVQSESAPDGRARIVGGSFRMELDTILRAELEWAPRTLEADDVGFRIARVL